MPRVSDNANRADVQGMARAILTKVGASAHIVSEATTKFTEYEATYPDPMPEGAGCPGPQAGREWKFSATGLTYNATSGDWISKDMRVLQKLFGRLVDFAKHLGAEIHSKGISVALEESTADGEHVHCHVYTHLEKEFRSQAKNALDVFVFEGIRPHVEPNTAKGPAYKGAVGLGHFYVVVDKVGSIFEWTNFPPFQNYRVEAWWIDNLLKEQKLTRSVFLKWAAKLCVGFQRRWNDVKAAEKYEREEAMQEAARTEAEALQVLPMKEFPEVKAFLAHFSGQRFHRRPVLAIVGGTNLGKSMLAGNVLREVGKLVDAPSFLEVTVEDHEHLDFADFDRKVHSGVLLDGVADALILKKNREALQGRAKLCKGGQSATNIYSYAYTICKRAAVATFDLSAKNLDAFSNDHWLSNEKNVIVLRLTEKAFVEPPATSVTQSPRPTAGGRAWAERAVQKRRWDSSSSPLGASVALPLATGA